MIAFYNSISDDGGAIDFTSPISNDLENLFKNVLASESETGLVRYKKIFVNTDTPLTGVLLAISKKTNFDDEHSIFFGTDTDTTANFDNSNPLGQAQATAELDRETKQILCNVRVGILSDYFKPNDSITFIDLLQNKQFTASVNTVGADFLQINEVVPISYITKNALISNSVIVGNLGYGEAVPIWVKNTIPPLSNFSELKNPVLAIYRD